MHNEQRPTIIAHLWAFGSGELIKQEINNIL